MIFQNHCHKWEVHTSGFKLPSVTSVHIEPGNFAGGLIRKNYYSLNSLDVLFVKKKHKTKTLNKPQSKLFLFSSVLIGRSTFYF